jgi:regulation of enolase protein 1 (concanavalin A-like superfamily)
MAFAAAVHGAEAFNFSKPLDGSWKWIREDPSAWRITNGALEIRLLPGNMWGPANDAKNVLTRPAPDPASVAPAAVEILVTVTNRPTEQYEQVDLVWYYADSHMVKIGQELVDGKLSVVMGREEGDRTRTMSINPIDAYTVDLRLVVTTNRIAGFFRAHKAREWQNAGNCSLPVLSGAAPKISLQCYQGPGKVERWARITDLRVNKHGL